MTEDAEEWRPVVGYDCYEVSSLGRVRSIDHIRGRASRSGSVYPTLFKGRLLRQRSDSNGYPAVGLSTLTGSGEYKSKTARVSILVCIAFYGPRPSGAVAAHWNGDSGDSRAGNLRWATYLENSADQRRHGTINHGARNGMAKLTEDTVRQIRDEISKTQRQIAEEFGISQALVSLIRTGRGWTHI